MLMKIIEKIGSMSEVLASLSIIAAATLFISEYVESKKTDLQATIVNSSSEKVTIFFSNVAGQDIVLKKAVMHVPEFNIKNIINLDDSKRLIKTKETLVVESLGSLLNTSVLIEEVAKYDNWILPGVPCFLEVTFVNVHGEQFDKAFEHACFADSFES
ncbi:hypothetical protein ERW49_18260 [Aliivibrio finisterrensis]|uniref:Uncharacterized protein n=2 Tax=Aliivibrio TaxID=511678 RepID=A0A4V1Z6K3_9GAMM|nr:MULTISPECIES: hypothetical protein [Aliivibrio]ACH63519.1 hypothetical protein VFMJ11_A0721 [Aliivibrio fischeri MJ11]RYU42120.1 hypothetical protein ERW49_18260 [Aliivibrio finisterrensis]